MGDALTILIVGDLVIIAVLVAFGWRPSMLREFRRRRALRRRRAKP